MKPSLYKISDLRRCFKDLRDHGYGPDTWPAFENARYIAYGHLPKGDLVDRVLALERARKGGKFKDITGNGEFRNYFGGKNRNTYTHKVRKWPSEDLAILHRYFPPNQSERARWLKSEEFDAACRALHKYHKGQVIVSAQGEMKKFRKPHDGKCKTYILYDTTKTHLNGFVKIGKTTRTVEERLLDFGVIGEDWELLGIVDGYTESQVKTAMLPWRKETRRGVEGYQLDANACLVLDNLFGFNIYAYGVSLPWRKIEKKYTQLDFKEFAA